MSAQTENANKRKREEDDGAATAKSTGNARAAMPWDGPGLATQGPRYVIPPLTEFNLKLVKEDATVLISGKRREGKTFLLTEICYFMKHLIPAWVCYTKTEFNGHWQQFIPGKAIVNGYQPDHLATLLDRQKRMITARKKDPRLGVIFDDTASDPGLKWDPGAALETVAFNGRHCKMFMAVTTQRLKRIVTGFRENADFVFLFYSDSRNTRETAWSEWMAELPKEVAFGLYDANTTGFNCLVINRSCADKSFHAKYFTYKAHDVPAFRLGSDAFWKAAEQS
jgi:hypothetical protein